MRPWLPPASDGEVAAAIAALLADWPATWFSAAPVLTCTPRTGGATLDHPKVGSEHVLVTASPVQRAAMALNVLGGQADPANARDNDVLTELGQAIIADLVRLLQEVVGVLGEGPISSTRRWWTFRAPDGALSVEIGLSEQAQCRVRQRAAGRGREPRIGSLASALAGEAVSLGCHLGAAQITAAELQTLAAGDVIMFDRTCREKVPLVVNGVTAPVGTARIVAGQAGVDVKLADPLKLYQD